MLLEDLRDIGIENIGIEVLQQPSDQDGEPQRTEEIHTDRFILRRSTSAEAAISEIANLVGRVYGVYKIEGGVENEVPTHYYAVDLMNPANMTNDDMNVDK